MKWVYGYGKDGFRGKKKFEKGMEVEGGGEEVMGMMGGVVVKVGEEKWWGKYVRLGDGE